MESLTMPLKVVLVLFVSFILLLVVSKFVVGGVENSGDVKSVEVENVPHGGAESMMVLPMLPAGGDLSITFGGAEATGPIEPLILEDRKVVEIPDAEGLWWYYIEHEDTFQQGLVQVSSIVGKAVETGEDGSYSNEALQAALTLQVHDWDFSTLGTDKRWMPVAEWVEQNRTNGGDGVIRCTPVLETNPFDKAWRDVTESPKPDAVL